MAGTGAIRAALRDAERGATVLMGDINEWFLWGQPSRWLHAYFEQTATPRTFPARLPLLALDRIWARPASSRLTSPLATSAMAPSSATPVRSSWN
jgi:endonuclease/exonuclease/phosphatase family metal-dependent hydrolase